MAPVLLCMVASTAHDIFAEKGSDPISGVEARAHLLGSILADSGGKRETLENSPAVVGCREALVDDVCGCAAAESGG